MSQQNSIAKSNDLETKFATILLNDILHISKRTDEDGSQNNKRELIRTIYTAIEGYVWLYKEDIKSIASDIGILDPSTRMAFEEKNYKVADTGILKESDNFMPTLTMFRFASRIAQKINPDLQINFNTAGWQSLKHAQKVRNRITHPKKSLDLTISDSDIEAMWEGVLWLIASVEKSLKLSIFTQKSYLNELKIILQKLEDKDPEYFAMYQRALEEY